MFFVIPPYRFSIKKTFLWCHILEMDDAAMNTACVHAQQKAEISNIFIDVVNVIKVYMK